MPRLIVALVFALVLWQGVALLGQIGPDGAHRATHPAFSLQKLATMIGIVLFLAIACAPILGPSDAVEALVVHLPRGDAEPSGARVVRCAGVRHEVSHPAPERVALPELDPRR